MIRLLCTTALLAALCAACTTLPSAGGLALRHDVEFKGPASETAFQLKATEAGIDVEDALDRRLARLTLEGSRLRVEDQRGELRGFVLPPGEKARTYTVVQADGTTRLFELGREPDGDLNLEDAAGEDLYKIKLRDDGYKIEETSGAVETRVKVRADKISLRNAADETFLSTRDPLSPEAAAVISLDKVPFEFAAGLAVAISHWGFGAQ